MDPKRHVAIPLFVLFFCLSHGSVMAEEPRRCTEIGGSDYLQVKFSAPLTLQTKFTLTFDVATGSISCPLPANTLPDLAFTRCPIGCDSSGLIFRCTPKRIAITLSNRAATKRIIIPQYQPWYPNGEGCEPERIRAIEALNTDELLEK